jgi:hypothetical protein
MPYLGQYQYLLKSVFFLYESAADAKVGAKFGGTGVIVAVHSEQWGDQRSYYYGVTNWHVAVSGGKSVVRLNCKEGPPDVLEFDPGQWYFKPAFHDIAVIPLELDDRHDVSFLGPSIFRRSRLDVPVSAVARPEITPGEDVFMIGRFVDYDGIETNEPAMRFGNISILRAPIKQWTNYMGPSIIVDMHSRTGFSGSPVFVYRTAGSIFSRETGPFLSHAGSGHMIYLLGLHWGQFSEWWELGSARDARKAENSSTITNGKYVKGLSGMTCVIPAEAIWEVLDMPDLTKMRAVKDKRA